MIQTRISKVPTLPVLAKVTVALTAPAVLYITSPMKMGSLTPTRRTSWTHTRYLSLPSYNGSASPAPQQLSKSMPFPSQAQHLARARSCPEAVVAQTLDPRTETFEQPEFWIPTSFVYRYRPPPHPHFLRRLFSSGQIFIHSYVLHCTDITPLLRKSCASLIHFIPLCIHSSPCVK